VHPLRRARDVGGVRLDRTDPSWGGRVAPADLSMHQAKTRPAQAMDLCKKHCWRPRIAAIGTMVLFGTIGLALFVLVATWHGEAPACLIY